MGSALLRLSLCLAAMHLSSTGLAQPSNRTEAVTIGGGELDACGTLAEVAGLGREADRRLSVRGGPDVAFRPVDWLRNGRRLHVCDRRGDWVGVVYGPDRSTDCGVSTPSERKRPYGGPCKSGWVHSRFVRGIAG